MKPIISGGLGSDQTGDIQKALADLSPYTAGKWDGWRNTAGMLRCALDEHANGNPIALIGHSFGGWAIVQVADHLAELGVPVAYMAFVDPVDIHWKDLELPGNCQHYDWFRRKNGWDFSFTVRAWVNGASPVIINGGHNAVPHAAAVVDKIAQSVRGLRQPV
jgi:pimeloyl-ACP methyl ester carboxylesterase